MSAVQPTPAGPPAAETPFAPPPRPPLAVRPLVVQAAALLLAGVAVGLLWAALTPTFAGWSQGIEKKLSGEVTLSVLGVAAGLVVAVVGLVRPGRQPLPATAVRLLGSVAASLIAWPVGALAGAPRLAATGVVVLWPLTTSAVTAAVTLAHVLFRPAPHP